MAFNLATAFVRHHMKSATPPRGGSQWSTHGVMQQVAASLRPGALAGADATQFSSLAGLGEKMQREATQQQTDQQLLAAQQEANNHLGALAGAAAGSALRVQVVGAQAEQW
jgi:hypothetical protein